MFLFPPLNNWETEAQKDQFDPHLLQNLLHTWQLLLSKIWVQFLFLNPTSLLHWSCWRNSGTSLPKQLPRGVIFLFIYSFIHISLLIFSRKHSSSSPSRASFWQLQKKTNHIFCSSLSPSGTIWCSAWINPRAAGNILLEMQHSECSDLCQAGQAGADGGKKKGKSWFWFHLFCLQIPCSYSLCDRNRRRERDLGWLLC